jgi:hypothetical protein
MDGTPLRFVPCERTSSLALFPDVYDKEILGFSLAMADDTMFGQSKGDA